MLEHPGLAAISCEDCKRWIVDLRDERFAGRGGNRQARKPNQPTPCRVCPKESPEQAAKIELTPAHWRTLRMYLRCRATCGRSLSEAEAADPIVAHHFAIIDVVFRSFDRAEAARTIAESLPMSRKHV